MLELSKAFLNRKTDIGLCGEYGKNSFDFTSQGTPFIAASIIINEEEKEAIEAALEAIRKGIFKPVRLNPVKCVAITGAGN